MLLKNIKAKSRLGERRIMKCGEECEIIEYRSALDIVVKFLKSGELIDCQYDQFKKGTVKSHFTPSIFGVGIVGLESTVDKSGKQIKIYEAWKAMIRRCYSEKYQQKQPTYKDCEVCEEWKYYPDFKKWYEENYYEVGDETMCLDKDILNKGNKVYSPDNCVFVPKSINSLFVKRQKNRGGLPIGVCWSEQDGKYQASCSIFDLVIKNRKQKTLGRFDTPKEAFNAYKKAKEENIKLIADYYKDQIPQKLYEAMYRYRVHIDD